MISFEIFGKGAYASYGQEKEGRPLASRCDGFSFIVLNRKTNPYWEVTDCYVFGEIKDNHEMQQINKDSRTVNDII